MSTAHKNKATGKSEKHDLINKSIMEITVYIMVLFLLLLTSINLNHYLAPQKTEVLGAKTEYNPEDFWKGFLAENKHYIPGWIEIGRIDKAAQIDPNYFLK
jgi:hypothetical protein